MSLPHTVFGIKPVLEAIVAGKTIDKLFMDHTAKGVNYQEIFTMVRHKKIPCNRVPTVKLNQLASKNHQGIVAILSPVPLAKLSHVIQKVYEAGKLPLIILLDGVTDIGNLGAIARTAVCVGADALVLPVHGGALLGGNAMRTSAGALAHLSICKESNLQNTLTYLKESGIQVVACYEKATQTIYEANLKGPIAIVLGGEEKGIQTSLRLQADQCIAIPMVGPINALNVSVAAGVILYETFRQRHSVV